MRKTVLLTILLSILRSGSAQTDSLLNEIQSTENTKSILISKGRNLLLQKFQAGDLDKVSKIENYLTEQLADQDFMALYPIEQWLIEYWTKNYNKLIDEVISYDSLYELSRSQVLPQSDNLYKNLLEQTFEHKQQIIRSINDTSIRQETKDFLLMHLIYCLAPRNIDPLTQDTLNYLADNFILDYPNSELINFTRQYIRYVLVPSKWGFAFEFFSGYGIFSGDLKHHFTNSVPMGVAFDVRYKNYVLYLRDFIGFSFTGHDFTDKSVVWKKDSQVRVFLPEASLGYTFVEKKHFALTPFIGISSTDIAPTQYDQDREPDLEDYELSFTTTYTLGLNLDLKFGKFPFDYMVGPNEQSSWFIRIRYAYNVTQFSKYYPGFGGNMHYITIGVGGLGRKISRDF